MTDSEVLTQKSAGNNTADFDPDIRSRGWCLTLWTNQQLEYFKTSGYQYLCYAPEICPDTGRFHWQAYVYYRSQKKIKTLWRECPDCRIQPAKGTAEENRIYIFGPYDKDGKHKDANPEAKEIGEMPNQGKRNDLKEFHKAIAAGVRGRALNEEHLAVRAKYPRLEKTLVFEEDEEYVHEYYNMGGTIEVHIRWGEPGVGKTKYVYDTHGVHNIFKPKIKKDGQMWWNGYRGQPVVLIDEFNGQIAWEEFLELIDRYPVLLEVKGDMVWRKCTHIYITSNFHPDSWYGGIKMAAMYRRFTSVTEVKEEAPAAHPNA